MSIEVKIPAVGESISSGVVSVWHRKSGDFVKAGEPLFTLETDKVSTEIVAEKDGLLSTNVAEGQEVKIGEVVATIDESASPPVSQPAEEAKPDTTGSEPVTKTKASDSESLSPAVRRIVVEEDLDLKKIKGSGKGGRLTKGDVLAAAQDRGVEAEVTPDRRVDRSQSEA